MEAKRYAIRFCGWLALMVGYGLALLLIRGVFIGITRGFGAAHFQAIWIVVALPAVPCCGCAFLHSGAARIVDCKRHPTSKCAVRVGPDSTGYDSSLQLRCR